MRSPPCFVLGALLLVAAPAASQTSGGGVDVSTGGWAESTIAVNPLDPDNIAVASNELEEGQSLRVSTDGGATFSAPAFPSVPFYRTVGDPSIAFDGRGRLFWTHLAQRRLVPGKRPSRCIVADVTVSPDSLAGGRNPRCRGQGDGVDGAMRDTGALRGAGRSARRSRPWRPGARAA
jgi:hypothetical protein